MSDTSQDATRDNHCAETCAFCAKTCYETALNHCLEMGGEHVEPQHFRLMLECVKVCETSACLQLSRSSFSHAMCQLCADVCDACADSCEEVGNMEACVQACRHCADSCRQMAA